MRRPAKDDGATALEFALVAPIVLVLVFAVIYAGIYFFYAAVADHVARTVSRDASIPSHGVYPTQAEEQALAESTAGSFLPSPTNVTLSPTPSQAEGNELTVSVSYDIPGLGAIGGLLPFLPKSGTLTRSVTVRYE